MRDDPVVFTSKWAFDRNPVLRFVHGRRLTTDLAFVRLHGGGDRNLLDYGCGDGHILRGASSDYRHVVGVDAIEDSLEGARVLGVPDNGAIGDVDDLPELASRYGPFHTVSYLQVLEHVADPERDRILDAVDAVSAADATVVVEVPIESGPILLAKVVVRAVLKLITRGRYTPERYSAREVFERLSVRRAPHIRPPSKRSSGKLGANGFGHKNFSVWNLRTYLAERYEIVEERFLPFNPLRWLNLQAVFICKKR